MYLPKYIQIYAYIHLSFPSLSPDLGQRRKNNLNTTF